MSASPEVKPLGCSGAFASDVGDGKRWAQPRARDSVLWLERGSSLLLLLRLLQLPALSSAPSSSSAFCTNTVPGDFLCTPCMHRDV